MKIEYSLLVLVIGMCLIVAGLFIVTPVENAKGRPHGTVSSMAEGGDSAARHAGWPLIVGWIFGVLQIGFFVGMAVFAVRNKPQGSWSILLVGGLFLLVFALLIATYIGYVRQPTSRLWGSFPAPTAWLVYGLWTVPMIFTLLYMIFFPRWIYGPNEARQFAVIRLQFSAPPGSDDDPQAMDEPENTAN